MFYNQPLAVRFGTEVIRHLDYTTWDRLDIAVAWVRASGMAHLQPRLIEFLGHGGELSIVAGIDLLNTTREGLAALLELETHGRAETFVYHNESGIIFHPKLYLFRNHEEARLIVGSNNLTQAGLYVNVEAGLQVDLAASDSVVVQTLDALSTWKDVSTGLVRKLDQALLDRLASDGYLPDEAAARVAMQAARQAARRDRPATPRVPIFSTKRVHAPVIQRPRQAARLGVPATATVPTAGTGTALLMRLRKASVTDRPTQTQIPIRLLNTAFFKNIAAVRSAHSGLDHEIHEASARGAVNTVKLEIPEMRHFTEPFARFERSADAITYEVYDVGTPQGDQIKQVLERGRIDGSTQLTISDTDRATWWRFI